MIFTRTWLNEFIDTSAKSLSDISATLNSIGIEVDSTHALKAPDKVVVGFVKEKAKLENSDKLNICQVDVGAESPLQIVCGAKNVEAGQFVAVALVGTHLPNGVSIKKAKLRGVESCGMICSSTELGFAKINDGIMVLDESIGELVTGKALNEYEPFNDEFIEVELTPNRGDCLSVYGIARDLAAAWDMDLKKRIAFKEPENVLGIGRILRINAEKDLNSNYIYRVIELANEPCLNLLISLRLATIQALDEFALINFLHYATHSTGVIFNAYDLKALPKENEENIFKIVKQEQGQSEVYKDDKLLSVSGFYQEDTSKITKESKFAIIEANYTDMNVIAKANPFCKKSDSNILYRSFRGSEPDLAFGLEYLLDKMSKCQNIAIFAGMQQILNEKPSLEIKFTATKLSQIVGKELDKNEIVCILQRLGFKINLIEEQLVNVKVPAHRGDVKNVADICEEIVRIIGIDSIASKPLEFSEKTRLTQSYEKYLRLKNLRQRATTQGFFESVHYVFDSEEELHKFGFAPCKLKLINPLNLELNALRTTLINHLLKAASFNAKNSKKMIKLFESGIVFDENANERQKFALIYSGFKEEAKIANKAKPPLVSFYDFLLSLKNIIGEFELRASNLSFLSPYEQAFIYKNDKNIGYVGRLHLSLENDKEVLKTYLCELDLGEMGVEIKRARVYSKFPSVSRDLSILVPKTSTYDEIKKFLSSLQIPNLCAFRIIDLYSDESLKEHFSLSINFIFQAEDKTLEENEINTSMDEIINALKEKLGLKLR